MYPGIGISIFGLIPAISLYYTVYEYSKVRMPFHNADLNNFTAGMVAEAVSCVFWVPIDIIKERL